MKKIAIDAGHGLYTAGKRCERVFDQKETREWIINNAVAKKVVDLLKNYECEIIRTDDIMGITDVALESRCKKANNFNADVFISIHHNATDIKNKATGIEVYCCKGASNQTLNLRDTMYNALLQANENKGNRADGTREEDFYVLKHTKMSAVLIENGFMSTKTDVELILTDEYQLKSATGIVNALVKFLDLKKKNADDNANKEQFKKEDTTAISIELNILKKGSKSNEVRTLQTLVNNSIKTKLDVDGVFGVKTLAAVKQFQTFKKISADGIVGTVTWNKLLK